MAGMAGIAAMAPLALSAGTALIGSGGYVGDPIVTPYGSLPVSTYAVPVVPDVHTPAFAPVQLPGGFGLPGADAQRHDLGG